MKIHPQIQQLAADIDAFCAAEHITATEFGIAALNDGRFRGDLGRGRVPSLRTIDRARFYIEHGRRAEEAA